MKPLAPFGGTPAQNYVAMLKKNASLPLGCVVGFARAAQLSDEEREELLFTRVMELNGQKSEICVETLAQWAHDAFSAMGDEAVLLDLWRQAVAPAPDLLHGLLADPARAARIAETMNQVVQAELQSMAAEAAEG